MKAICSTFVLLLFISSCAYNSKDVKETIATAGNLIETYPDSALILLESVYYPDKLSKSQFADYTLFTTWAKDKAYKDIARDSLIFQLKDYYCGKKNWEKATLAAFYSGRVYQERKDYDRSFQAYLNAETLSKQISDETRKGLIQYFIGDLHYDQSLYSEAIIRFQSAYEHFKNSPGNYAREELTLNIIGNCFLLAKQKEKALIYFDKAIKLSENQNDPNQTALTRHNLGVAFLENNDIRLAKNELHHALRIASDTSLQAKIYLTLAGIYEKEIKIDSALYFSNQATQLLQLKKDDATLASAYRILSRLEEKKGNLAQSLNYHRQYIHHYHRVKDEKERVNLLDLQKKYDFELIKGINNRLLIQKQWGLLALAVLIIVIFLILFIFYHKHQQNKDALCEARQTTYQLKEMMNNRDNSIHAFVVKEFDVAKKISILEGCLIGGEKGKDILKKVHKILYEKDSLDWLVLYQIMNKLHKGDLDKMKTAFPDLSEMEFKICCLTKSGFNNTEIAIILESNPNIIQIRKTAIRKKLNINTYGDITKFINEFII